MTVGWPLLILFIPVFAAIHKTKTRYHSVDWRQRNSFQQMGKGANYKRTGKSYAKKVAQYMFA
jgi:hypothetical protein